ncbi:MAG: N,N-dimethylformamidase large subunit [Acetobacteraceae bacterium]|nr:N,N-dimethylformamidase large subunit [Acetobacteraceae bacterium]
MFTDLPITGYLDRFSHRPGETFTAHVALRAPGPAQARLVKVISGDPNPAGPGMRFEDRAAIFTTDFAGAQQPIALGSHGRITPAPDRSTHAACTWTAVLLTGLPGETRTVLSEADGTATVTLRAGSIGVQAELSWPGGSVVLQTDTKLHARAWYRLWLSADPATGAIVLGQTAAATGATTATTASASNLRLPAGGTLLIAAENPSAPTRHFTGKIEEPALHAGLVRSWPTALAASDLPLIARWNFALAIDSQTIVDTGRQNRHGILVNTPTRGVVGAHWRGREHCWRHAPGDYAAIHFHDDDLDDCRWQPSFTFTVPDGLASGAYALHLTCAEGEDWLPLYVLPKKHGPHAPIAFLAPTFTYQAYANHARGNADADYLTRVAAWGAYPHNADHWPLYGRSTYNKHEDGSGIAFSSRRRPILTMRPGYLTFNDPLGSGLRHYPADTHLLAWLTARGLDFDVITDEDLDDEGADLIRPYKTVLTGSHPEYHTPGTLDALAAYTSSGGKLAYLGGNGFYWRIARDRARPHMIEIRRAEGGIRAWAAEAGEYYHAIDGEMGGLWRRNRRPPQQLAGVGFSGQGTFEGTHYRRLPASYEGEHAWIFAGINEEIVGDYGLSGGGAAGFELDRADPMLGTPENAVILARSEDPPESFVTVHEELLGGSTTISGEDADELMRGEIVYFDTPSGGAVFAVGSITFCGSLWRDGRFDGPISRLLENVVRRFAGQ